MNNIQDDVILNLINVSATREQFLELVTDSINLIGSEKADEFARITDDTELITALIRYRDKYLSKRITTNKNA